MTDKDMFLLSFLHLYGPSQGSSGTNGYPGSMGPPGLPVRHNNLFHHVYMNEHIGNILAALLIGEKMDG